MSSEGGEKTEEPTDKKIEDSRREGQVWKSQDLSGVLVFFAGLFTARAMWPYVESEFTGLFAFSFEKVAHPTELALATYHLALMGWRTFLILTLPVLGVCAVVGGVATFLQVGPLLSPKTVLPKLEKMNPLAGLKNMFSKKSFVELLKSLLKISIAAYVAYGVVEDAIGMVAGTIHTDAQGTLAVLGELIFRICLRVGLLFIVFALFDVWWQRRQYFKELMMTKDEVKREYKESEGDPHHKAKRKELHMEILEGAQMEAVKSADVVVTNPTHLAIALKYDREKDKAPRVICKGLNTRAEAIRELARKSNVALLRNVPLAQALFRLDVGQDIPEELYDAVAEVLNFVYALQDETKPPRTG